MSGITGLFRLNGRPVEGAELDGMITPLAHRRLDATAAWREGCVGLGYHDAAQNGLHITADARLDNRAEICATLGAPSYISDSELILRSYASWGERCVEHMLGDFAFAIWDAGSRRLMCARDHIGVKPFYYHYGSGRLFAWASEIKGLLALQDVPRRINETRIADYLATRFDDTAATFYHDVFRLPPAHRLVVTCAGARLERYWALDPTRELRLPSDDAFADAFRELFTEAVRCRLPLFGTNAVGAMLSGGLDSSSIVCVARGLLGSSANLQTFSVVFDDLPECDERSFITAVLAGGGCQPHNVRGDSLEPLLDLDGIIGQQDEPFYAPNLFLHAGLYQSAQAAGVRVLLDGLDGDTTVSHGIARLVELAAGFKWIALAREAWALRDLLGQPAWRILRDRAFRPLVPTWLRRAKHILSGDNWAAATPLPARSARAEHWSLLTSGFIPFALEVADRAAAVRGLEVRYPFFDRRLIEFCLALPADQKLRHGQSRYIVRRALAGVLPQSIRDRRTKADLHPNFLRGFIAGQHRWEELIAAARRPPLRDLIDQRTLDTALDGFRLKQSRPATLAMWTIITLVAWMKQAAASPNDTRRTPMDPKIPENGRSDVPDAPKSKQPYVTPVLITHGTIEAITRKLTTGASDGLSGSTMI